MSTRILAGFRSRWITPCWWAWWIARATSRKSRRRLIVTDPSAPLVHGEAVANSIAGSGGFHHAGVVDAHDVRCFESGAQPGRAEPLLEAASSTWAFGRQQDSEGDSAQLDVERQTRHRARPASRMIRHFRSPARRGTPGRVVWGRRGFAHQAVDLIARQESRARRMVVSGSLVLIADQRPAARASAGRASGPDGRERSQESSPGSRSP